MAITSAITVASRPAMAIGEVEEGADSGGRVAEEGIAGESEPLTASSWGCSSGTRDSDVPGVEGLESWEELALIFTIGLLRR